MLSKHQTNENDYKKIELSEVWNYCNKKHGFGIMSPRNSFKKPKRLLQVFIKLLTKYLVIRIMNLQLHKYLI